MDSRDSPAGMNAKLRNVVMGGNVLIEMKKEE